VKRVFILAHDIARQRAAQALREAPEGYKVVISEQTRSGDQNAIFHAMCGDIAKSGMAWMGKARSPEEWKVLLVSGHSVATKQGAEVVPGLEGEFVNIRESTASMGKSRANSLIEYSMAFMASHGMALEAA
jgi:hypothetical protein